MKQRKTRTVEPLSILRSPTEVIAVSEQCWSSTGTTEEDHADHASGAYPKVFAQWRDSKEAIEGVLLESPTLRSRMAQRTEVLERVGELRLLPDGVHAASSMVAEYYAAEETTIRQMVVEHRDELEANGYHTVTGARLSEIKSTSFSRTRRAPIHARCQTCRPCRAVRSPWMLATSASPSARCPRSCPRPSSRCRT